MLEDFRLRVFATVAECGSFTKAAQKLGISQPAVSQNISLLEQAMGLPLLDRTRGAIALTDKGTRFLDYTKKILSLYERMDTVVARGEADPSPATTLRLDATTLASVSTDTGSIVIDITHKSAND